MKDEEDEIGFSNAGRRVLAREEYLNGARGFEELPPMYREAINTLVDGPLISVTNSVDLSSVLSLKICSFFSTFACLPCLSESLRRFAQSRSTG